MKKVLLIFGTRPEAIKMLPLFLELKASIIFEPIICLSGQHKELLNQVLELFDVKPDYNLSIMKKDQDLFSITSDILLGLKDILQSEKPDLVMVHGDTTTSMAAALSSFYLNIPVAHIEAGLRSNNSRSPFPEEMNRNITSKLATYHFSPTAENRENLLDEGINGESIFVTGNTGIDALKYIISQSKKNLKNSNIGYDLDRLNKGKKMVLITGHRRENFGSGFERVFKAIKKLTEKYIDCDFVYPMHLNPNVRKSIFNTFSSEKHKNLFLIEPLNYFDFVRIMQNSYLILSDSGGIQEEAPSLGKPVLVMRENTERPEGIESGTCKLVGTSEEKIISEVSKLIEDSEYYNSFSKITNPYGEGKSSKRILEILMKIYEKAN
ncbi:MAG: UDP-N-acetylglucosamine 2-epimerase (non-hydrolyzing) [Flavobacteriaceae bacterium]|nr:UDP-N-acetylglucosamine 2-epimerase (non-hydrolyzing) [Flavobacteriaceae bacterium]